MKTPLLLLASSIKLVSLFPSQNLLQFSIESNSVTASTLWMDDDSRQQSAGFKIHKPFAYHQLPCTVIVKGDRKKQGWLDVRRVQLHLAEDIGLTA